MTNRRFKQICRVLAYTDAEMAAALSISEDRVARLKAGTEEITPDLADCIIELYQSR